MAEQRNIWGRNRNTYGHICMIDYVILTTPVTHSLLGSDERSRILRSLLFSLGMTPLLLLLEPVRRIVSWEATLAAITLGIVLGVVAATGVANVSLQYANSVPATIVAFVSVAIVTVVVWLIIPHRYIGTVLQFTIAFMWAMPVTELLYHRLRSPEPR